MFWCLGLYSLFTLEELSTPTSASSQIRRLRELTSAYKAGPATNAETTSLMSINVPKNGNGTMDYYVSGNVLEKSGTLTDNPYSISLVKDDEGNPIEGGYEPNISETPVIDNGLDIF